MATVKFAYTADNKYIVVKLFHFTDADVLKVKKIPGRIYDGDRAAWLIPFRAESFEPLVTFATALHVTLPPALMNELAKLSNLKRENALLSMATHAPVLLELSEPLRSGLRPFQNAAAQYIAINKRVLVADVMGLGKTVEAIAGTEIIGELPALVICPASVKYNWKYEIERWVPARRGHIALIGSERLADPPEGIQYAIVNYEMLRKHGWIWRFPFRTIIIDESHYMKNPKSQRTNFCLDLAKHANNVILLSGTPYEKGPIELVPQLQALRVLDSVFGGFWGFAKEFCHPVKTEFGTSFDGAENLQKLNTMLRANCFIRRKPEEVLPELPEKIRSIIMLEIDNREEYDHAKRELLEYIRERGRVDKKFMDGIADLVEAEKAQKIRAYRASKAYKAARARALVQIETLKQISARGKLVAVASWLRDFFASTRLQEKIVIFAVHHEIIEELARILKTLKVKSIILTGGSTPVQRMEKVKEFQDEKDKLVFLANMQAGGIGITLTAARYELFLEYGPHASIMDQAEDRCHRIGQKGVVNIYWAYGIQTIDEWSTKRIEKTRIRFEQGIQGTDETEDEMIASVVEFLESEKE